jgi:NAD(P)-dependent dehydrogenase (short-subunit alcohol dehydrogenase family)
VDDGRVWLITGASSGFGLAIAKAALDRGDRVVATSRRGGSIEGLNEGDRLSVIPLDVTEEHQRAAAVDATIERFGRLDVLVNNAGRTQVGAVEEALKGFTEALQEEVAPFGIRTLIVEPGAFRTGLFRPGAAYLSEEMEEYAETVGPTRVYVHNDHLKQPGDPALAAKAILTALDAEDPPLRLVLGADAIGNIRNRWERLRRELEQWEEVGRATGLEEAAPR